LEIFIGILQTTTWSCIHQGITKEQIGWLQKGLEDWTKLISETGMGWSTELGTIYANDEWWK